jgi:tRNA threonylcarbamoyladenosine biosynthesis protein TsaE
MTFIELPERHDTVEFGRRLADLARPGDVIVLSGPLGAGKTTLTQGIGSGLGVRAAIVSPTFVIARVHTDGRIPLVHVDAYRLGSLDEIDDLDLDVAVEDSLTVVEWGSGLAERLSESCLIIELSREETSERRSARLTALNGDWGSRLNFL